MVARLWGNGVGGCVLLLVVFVALKLTGVIDWSWLWITAPLWGCLVIAIVGYALIWTQDKRGIR